MIKIVKQERIYSIYIYIYLYIQKLTFAKLKKVSSTFKVNEKRITVGKNDLENI